MKLQTRFGKGPASDSELQKKKLCDQEVSSEDKRRRSCTLLTKCLNNVGVVRAWIRGRPCSSSAGAVPAPLASSNEKQDPVSPLHPRRLCTAAAWQRSERGTCRGGCQREKVERGWRESNWNTGAARMPADFVGRRRSGGPCFRGDREERSWDAPAGTLLGGCWNQGRGGARRGGVAGQVGSGEVPRGHAGVLRGRCGEACDTGEHFARGACDRRWRAGGWLGGR